GQEGEPGNDGKVVLSYGLWQSQFGGDAQAVGKDIRVAGQPYTVVGVMPKGFYFLNPDVMLWTALAFNADQKSDARRHSNNFQNIGRLKPGATVQRAQQQIDALNAANLDRFPQYKELLINARFHTTVVRLQDNLVAEVKATLYLMWGGALFVLLIGCVNVANLVLVRARSRLKELATRLALGAGRWRVGRQLITESVLLIGAGLLFASFRRVLAVDPGFNPDGVLTVSVNLPRARYGDDTTLRGFTDEALRRLRALPGVSAAGATNTIPMGGNNNDSVILAEGYQMSPGESVISPSSVDVTPGYFEAMGVSLVKGRVFDERDHSTARRTVIVDEKLAKRFWPNRDPIGRRMYTPVDINNLLAITDKTVFLYVVAVIRDVKLHTLTEGKQTVGAYYFPMAQDTSRGLTFALKTAGDPVT